MCDSLFMRGSYGGRLDAKQMKFPTLAAYTLDMNDYEIGVDNSHGEQDLEGDGCGYERDFCNEITEDGQALADVEDELEGDDDIYRQLAQKDKDLLLAAELGKALLDENKELNQKYEVLQEEYSQAVEVRRLNEYSLFQSHHLSHDWVCLVTERVVTEISWMSRLAKILSPAKF